MSKKKIFVVISLLIFFASCVPRKARLLFQGNSDSICASKVIDIARIHPRDQLYIKVFTFDDKSFDTDNSSISNVLASGEGVNILSFAVSDSGYVNLPFVGKINVNEKTLDEARSSLEQAFSEYLQKPAVIVKFVNRYVTVIGNVNRPGKYDFYQDKMSVVHAIGLAGDFNYYGNRSKITVIRTIGQNVSYHYLNLTDKNVANSEYFFLKPYDIVYVEPMKYEVWGITAFPFATVLSSITTLILILNYIKK